MSFGHHSSNTVPSALPRGRSSWEGVLNGNGGGTGPGGTTKDSRTLRTESSREAGGPCRGRARWQAQHGCRARGATVWGSCRGREGRGPSGGWVVLEKVPGHV